jgi:hypothetical protein
VPTLPGHYSVLTFLLPPLTSTTTFLTIIRALIFPTSSPYLIPSTFISCVLHQRTNRLRKTEHLLPRFRFFGLHAFFPVHDYLVSTFSSPFDQALDQSAFCILCTYLLMVILN